MSKGEKSVLDFIAWLSDLEERVEILEATSPFHIDTGKILIKDERILMDKAGVRKTSRQISFNLSFLKPPIIHIALTDIASKNNHDPSIQFEVTDVTEEGFMLIATTWQASNMHHLGVSWLAIEQNIIVNSADNEG